MDKLAQIQELFEQTLALPEDQRSGFLHQCCETSVRNQVLALLDADHQANGFIDELSSEFAPLIELNEQPNIAGYRLQKTLGEGGMGLVYQAFDEKLQRRVAIKMLPPPLARQAQQKQRFLLEAKATAALNHRNVADIYELGETDEGQLFIVYAFCEGEDLSKVLAKNALTLDQTLIVLIQLCDALAAAHQQHIFHRDLKPANIIVDRQFNIKLVDFGIAKMAGEDLSQTGQLIGTFNYMAPEQFTGSPVDARSDLWAVGILLYECLTGAAPFQANNAAEIMYLLFNSGTPQLADSKLPQQLRFNYLLQHTLCRDRQSRIASAELLAREFRALRQTLAQQSQLDFIAAGQHNSTPQANETRTHTEVRRMVTLAVFSHEAAPFEALKSLIKRFHGQIIAQHEQVLFACFGYPDIQEAAADVAIKCSQKIIEKFAELALALEVLPLLFRQGQQHPLAELTDSMEKFAGVLNNGELLLTQAVEGRVRGQLVEAQVERFYLDGQPVLRVSHPQSAFLQHTVREYRTPFIGRAAEFALLTSAWQAALENQARAVLVSGDAGLGKTRLLNEFHQSLQVQHTFNLLLFQTDPTGSHSAFSTIIDGLKQFLLQQFSHARNLQEQLQLWLQQLAVDEPQTTALLHWLMGLEFEPNSLSLEPLTPQALRTRSLQLLSELLERTAKTTPLLIIFEDLHWADSSSLEWLDAFLKRPLACKMLLLISGRPSLFDRWHLVAGLSHLPLNRLTQSHSQALIDTLLDEQTLAPEQQQKIRDTTAGNPLFIEEVTRMITRQGSRQQALIPDSLEEVLLSRVDRLGQAKQLAQTASIIGREFSADALARLEASTDKQTQLLLAQLVENGVVFHQQAESYAFSHALIRDALYNALSAQERKLLHKRFALQQSNHASEKTYEQIARHLVAADEHQLAIAWWLSAARAAQQRYALRETLRLCEQGVASISAVAKVPPEQELQLLLIQGPAEIAVNNYASAKVGEIYQRAVELAEKQKNDASLFTARLGLWSHLCVRARHQQASLLAERLLTFARQQNDHDLLVEAHMAAGVSALFSARLETAQGHLLRAAEVYMPSMTARHVALYGQCPAMAVYTFQALLYEALGEGEKALQASEQAVAAGRASMHPFSLGFALGFAVHIHLRQAAVETAMALRAEYQQLCQQQELHVFELLGAVQESLLLLAAGNLQAGIPALENALPPYKAFGTEIFLPSWYALLALSYLKAGKTEKAREKLQQAAQQMEISGERLSAPYIHIAEQALTSTE